MLTKEDKRWILETVNTAVNTATNSTVALLSAQIEELARMTARGFNACASKEELWAVENRLENRITGVENRLIGVEQRLTGVENHVGSLDSRLEHLEDIVVTRDYLDERLGIVKAKDAEIHKQLKLNSVTLVEELRRKKIIGPKRANTILAMEPFPQKLSK